MKHGAHHIAYADIINHMNDEVRWMERNYPSMKLQRKIQGEVADYKLACARAILKLLRAHKKDPQQNLNDLFDKMK